jgi:O-acetyl-ADP-ribose deacetylase (regulator of RNase III)
METIKQILFHNTCISIVRGDITESEGDAIVNAANSHLQHGGGVAGAISRKGGPLIQEESNRIGFVPVGRSAITSGGKLKARYVIHTVGPRWGEGDEENKLRGAVQSVLRLASEKGFASITLPAVSAGIFGFPKEACADILVRETAGFLRETSTTLRRITFCLIDEEMIRFFLKSLETINGES